VVGGQGVIDDTGEAAFEDAQTGFGGVVGGFLAPAERGKASPPRWPLRSARRMMV
jgi:hypothetical protein